MKTALNRYKTTPIGEQLAPYFAQRRAVRRDTPLFPTLPKTDKRQDTNNGNGISGQWPAYQG